MFNQNIFSSHFRSEPLPPIHFKFDTSLLGDMTGPLRPNELIADEYTTDALFERYLFKIKL